VETRRNKTAKDLRRLSSVLTLPFFPLLLLLVGRERVRRKNRNPGARLAVLAALGPLLLSSFFFFGEVLIGI